MERIWGVASMIFLAIVNVVAQVRHLLWLRDCEKTPQSKSRIPHSTRTPKFPKK